MVGGVDLHEHRAQALRTRAVEVFADQGIVDDHAEFAAVAELGVEGTGFGGVAFGDLLERTILEERADRAVDAPGAGAELTGLRLQPIELGEHLDGYGDRMFVEFEKGLGVVNQNVRIQHVGFLHEQHRLLFRHGSKQ